MNALEKLEKYKKVVNLELEKLMPEKEPKELYELMKYHIFAGGKRVRPALCLLACEAVSGSYEKALPAAASLEMVHAFTLVHDDVMDRDELRRGKPTLWKKYGEGLAINAGDGIFTKTYESALNLEDTENKEEILKILTKTIMEVCEGQAFDVSFEKKGKVSLEEYIKMATLKTASLIKASAKIGAMCGSGSQEELDALANYGEKVGLSFQIWDDYIDFASEKTGKTFGSDIKKGKKTSIVCHALENADEKDKERLNEILDKPIEKTDKKLINETVEILEKTGSIDYAKNYAFELVKDAKEGLDILEDSEAKEILLEFADFLVSRKD